MEAKTFLGPKSVTVPQLGLIAGTRVALGVGIGMLAADCLSKEQRKAVGWTLVAVGVLTTFPLVAQVFGGCCGKKKSEEPAAGE